MCLNWVGGPVQISAHHTTMDHLAKSVTSYPRNDKRFLRMMEMGTHKKQQGNREMSMLFCLPTTLMRNKWPLSVNPLNGLLRTLNRKPKMKEDYF